MKPFEVTISQLQPSQLYINASKLEKVKSWLPEDELPAVPVISMAHRLVITDGHTRIVAALLAGLMKIEVYFDEDDLDLNVYQTCVNWALEENIDVPQKLISRVISEEDYQELWIKRCEKTFKSKEE